MTLYVYFNIVHNRHIYSNRTAVVIKICERECGRVRKKKFKKKILKTRFARYNNNNITRFLSEGAVDGHSGYLGATSPRHRPLEISTHNNITNNIIVYLLRL